MGAMAEMYPVLTDGEEWNPCDAEPEGVGSWARCVAETERGEQCKRGGRLHNDDDGPFCFQHQGEDAIFQEARSPMRLQLSGGETLQVVEYSELLKEVQRDRNREKEARRPKRKRTKVKLS
jgi:hypothetical protein